MRLIRDVFTETRSLDRRIEKVIDYAATDDKRLSNEISEYEVTPSVAKGLQRFLDAFEHGVGLGDVTDVGVWVSGFYGSGKSSFTKYLGFALDRERTVEGEPFYERLAVRAGGTLATSIRAAAKKHRTAVLMLDLATEQLAESTAESVANVLYYRVLKQLGFSNEKKVADLELRLLREGRLDQFHRAYEERYPGKGHWTAIHNDPQIAVMRASQLVPKLYPDDYRDPVEFRQLKYQPLDDVKEVAQRMIDLIRRTTKRENIVFFVDEVGQYVAPRKELILNLDGLVRALKEVGKGKVWFVATAQQTLTEISEQSALNTTELFKLKDRFPTAIELEATDIREITARRLLTKKPEGERSLRAEWKARGEALQMHAHLHDWPGGGGALTADDFAKLYPFLPARFDLVLNLIRALARRTGGTGLRSAIRVIQDLLVDTNRILPAGTLPLADRPLYRLATIDDVYDALRPDIQKEVPQAVDAVDRILRDPQLGKDPLAVRAAKAVAALQPLDRPRTAENIAALLHEDPRSPGAEGAVRKALQQIVDAKEFGLVELRADAGAPGGAGFVFLSDEVQPLQKKRDAHVPATSEIAQVRRRILEKLFDPLPETRVEGTKLVQAGIRLGRALVAGESGAVLFQLEEVDPGGLPARVTKLEADTQTSDDLKNAVSWLFVRPGDAEERIADICRSNFIRESEGSRGKDRDRTVPTEVQRFLKAEERRSDQSEQAAMASYARALLDGVFLFRGRKRPVSELGSTVIAGATVYLQDVAARVFEHYRLVKKDVAADTAVRFLEANRLVDMPKERDPLGLVEKKGNRTAIHTAHPALHEALRAFRALVAASGSGRVHGSALLEMFNAPPYGWSKDTTRYLFAALLWAGEIEIHSGDGVLRTVGPKAVEALRNTQSFNRVGVAPRGEPVPLEALDRASRLLETMFGEEVLPLEDQISRVVRARFPAILEDTGSLPARLRLLGLPGHERAKAFLQTCADLLKEDAGGAASVLGGTKSTLAEDTKWALGIGKILDEGGGERDIRAARERLERARELADLFPQVGELAAHPAATTLDEVLQSETFYERIADLREASRDLTEAARGLYRAEREALSAALDGVRRRLEARPSWVRIGDDGRRDIAAELTTATFLEDPRDPFAALQRVLTRRLGLADFEERLVRIADQRARPEPPPVYAREAPPPEGQEAEPTSAEGPAAETVSVSDFVTEAVLATPADVDRWTDDLRARLTERVQLGPIRIAGDR
ncbi:MAG: BREX system P-loop protein BrxC [Polyangiaceae bacterium]